MVVAGVAAAAAAAADEVIRADAVETEEDVVEAPSARRLERRLDACSGESVWVLASTVTALGVRVRVTVTSSGESMPEAAGAAVAEAIAKLVVVPLFPVTPEEVPPELPVESVPVMPPVAPVAFMRDSALLSLVQNRVVP